MESFEEKQKLFKNISSKRNNLLKQLRSLVNGNGNENLLKPVETGKILREETKKLNMDIYSDAFKDELENFNKDIGRYRSRIKSKVIKKSTKRVKQFSVEEIESVNVNKQVGTNLENLPALKYKHVVQIYDNDKTHLTEKIDKFSSKQH